MVLFSSGSVQEMTQVQIKLQQAQSAKALSENVNKVLQVCSMTGTTLKTLFLKESAGAWLILNFSSFVFFYPKGGSG